RPDSQAAQRRDVSTRADRLADICNQGAYIRAARASDQQRGARTGTRRERLNLEQLDTDASRSALNVLAAPRLAVERLAADLDRAHHRRDLIDLPDEALQRLAPA